MRLTTLYLTIMSLLVAVLRAAVSYEGNSSYIWIDNQIDSSLSDKTHSLMDTI